jgi:hypothetical protein
VFSAAQHFNPASRLQLYLLLDIAVWADYRVTGYTCWYICQVILVDKRLTAIATLRHAADFLSHVISPLNKQAENSKTNPEKAQ